MHSIIQAWCDLLLMVDLNVKILGFMQVYFSKKTWFQTIEHYHH